MLQEIQKNIINHRYRYSQCSQFINSNKTMNFHCCTNLKKILQITVIGWCQWIHCMWLRLINCTLHRQRHSQRLQFIYTN